MPLCMYMTGVTSAGEGRLNAKCWRQHDRPAPGRRYLAAMYPAPQEPHCLQLARGQKRHPRARVQKHRHHAPKAKGTGACSSRRRTLCGTLGGVAGGLGGAPSEVTARPPISSSCAARSAGISPTARRAFSSGAASAPALILPLASSTAVSCAVVSKALIYLSKATQSNVKRFQRWNKAPPICMPRLVACGQSWQGGGWCACMVEDGGVWRMVVVCGRCEDDDDGSGVCMVVGWWVTHMALVPCA